MGGDGVNVGHGDVSLARLNVLRGMYGLNLVLLGSDVWPQLLGSPGGLAPTPGVAYAFWGALSALSALGLRYPLKMLPLIFMQLTYKTIWLLAVAMPLASAGELTSGGAAMVQVFVVGGVLDLIVVPWPYVIATFGRSPGDPWRRVPRAS